MKMEIELTDEQAKKVEILKENGMDVGEAIDALFEMKEMVKYSSESIVNDRIRRASEEKAELEAKMNKIDEELSFFEKLTDSSLDSTQKQKMVENEFGKINKTYDMSVQDTKHKFKWSKSIFKF
jgi:hypothetical protein